MENRGNGLPPHLRLPRAANLRPELQVVVLRKPQPAEITACLGSILL